jgi:hypothetical protein
MIRSARATPTAVYPARGHGLIRHRHAIAGKSRRSATGPGRTSSIADWTLAGVLDLDDG